MPDIYSILAKNKENFGQIVSELSVDTIENRTPVNTRKSITVNADDVKPLWDGVNLNVLRFIPIHL